MRPVALLTDERATPLDVTGPPEFGWLPQDASGDQAQAAYQLRVTDARSGAVVWDSGIINGGQEVAVPYRGPALAAGHSYRWTVRTWDVDGQRSDWATPASFDTGLSDQQWSGAQWIRRVTTGNDSIVDYTLARKQVPVARTEGKVVRARVYLAVEGQWQLHVDGQVVDTQDDYQSPGENYYDVEDVTALAQRAQSQGSAMAVGVKYGAWPTTVGNGRPQGPTPVATTLAAAVDAGAATADLASVTSYVPGERLAFGTPGQPGFEVATISSISGSTVTLAQPLAFAQPSGAAVVSENGPTGLLAKVVVDYADGRSSTTVSDGSWLVAKDAEEITTTVTRRTSQDAGTYIENLDARLALTGWDSAGYTPTAAWTPATAMGPHPLPEPSSCATYVSGSAPCSFTHLVPQQATLQYTTVHPVSVTSLDGGATYVADFGSSLIGVPVLDLAHGVAGRAVTLTGSYRLNGSPSTAALAPGATAVTVSNGTGFAAGDPVTVDAPADGYGAGHPETSVISAVTPGAAGSAVLTLSQPLSQAHAAGVWVQGSRAGTAPLDNQGTNLTFTDTESDGAQTTDFYVPEGFRYLQITGAGEPLAAAQISVTAQHTALPSGEAATFSSSNPTLDAVFGLMESSAVNAGQMEFQDSPDRQAGQFLGDAVDESYATTTALGERTLTRQAIQNFIFSQQRYWLSTPPGPSSQYGDLNATYPTGDGKRDIPDYTEMFPEWVMRYYEATGDRSVVAEAWPTMQAIATYVTDSIATSGPASGLIYQLAGGPSSAYRYGIIDWPSTDRYNTTVLNAGADTVVNERGAEVFRALSQAATVLGRSGDAATYGSSMNALVGAVNTKLVEPGGLYDDGLSPASGNPQIGNASEHDQSFAVTEGVAPAASYPSLGAYLASQGMQQGPMDLGQLEQALIATGQPAALVSLLTDPTADGPAKILAEGGTSMWEQWDPGCSAPGGAPGDNTASCVGAGIYQASSDSFSHGWGSVGVVGILQGLLGVTSTSPGGATLQIAPPSNGLAAASGTEWTEYGPVTVRWSRAARGMTVTVEVPDNVRATVRIPDSAGVRYVATGSGAPQPQGTAGGVASYSIGSGTSTFRPAST